ncbi:hypothetical protein SARC_09112 [Sphaeroforma arctica JP610]|uniref:Uncharacterized protein n=1 Tax=Sphaeroforma arctica JP610 TaxID=667725 RepID=A0A0L0FNQ1_9EUKA|nr:hypothetical protein SARC_09112 [Sphaeroforma arctica JP610]KNC78460.1 hypothetical protein SARC_09112 [Sphaeroforma arctica JP610]|eukprot:XP_014152362.1 hypothetical protein SARC_09112 [Sphaeroforma arctica JP610]
MAKVLLSFVLGASSAGGVGFFFLREDMKASNRFVSKRVQEMKHMVGELEDTMGGLRRLQDEVAEMKRNTATLEDFTTFKIEQEKQITQLTASLAEHKSKVWETQQAMFKALETPKEAEK